MKHFFYLLLGIFIFAACEKDDVDPNLIHYDGDNFSGPILLAGIHEFAVKFPPSELSDHIGKNLDQVKYYMGPNLPQSCVVKVYGPGTTDHPGTLLYTKDVTGSLKPGDWNTHTLSQNIEIKSEDLWVCIVVDLASEQQSVGCDSGPNNANGDWLESADGWQTYNNRTGEAVNWNIRAKVK